MVNVPTFIFVLVVHAFSFSVSMGWGSIGLLDANSIQRLQTRNLKWCSNVRQQEKGHPEL